MKEENEQDNIRRLIDLARQPRKGPIKVLAGAGEGVRCALCGEIIAPHQIQYDLEEGLELHMHEGCYRRWVRTA